MILEKKVNVRSFQWNDTFVSIPWSRPFLKIPKFKNREIGTHEIGYTCRFAKFNTREKSVFKKIYESRNLIPLSYAEVLWTNAKKALLSATKHENNYMCRKI